MASSLGPKTSLTMNVWYVTIGYMLKDDIVEEVYLKQANERQGFALEDLGGAADGGVCKQ